MTHPWERDEELRSKEVVVGLDLLLHVDTGLHLVLPPALLKKKLSDDTDHPPAKPG